MLTIKHLVYPLSFKNSESITLYKTTSDHLSMQILMMIVRLLKCKHLMPAV